MFILFAILSVIVLAIMLFLFYLSFKVDEVSDVFPIIVVNVVLGIVLFTFASITSEAYGKLESVRLKHYHNPYRV